MIPICYRKQGHQGAQTTGHRLRQSFENGMASAASGMHVNSLLTLPAPHITGNPSSRECHRVFVSLSCARMQDSAARTLYGSKCHCSVQSGTVLSWLTLLGTAAPPPLHETHESVGQHAAQWVCVFQGAPVCPWSAQTADWHCDRFRPRQLVSRSSRVRHVQSLCR